MGTTLTKPVLLDETGQDIVDKLDEIKTAIGSTGEFIPVMIKVTTPPTKTTYGAGETLDLTGMTIKLIGANGAEIDVTDGCTFSPINGATLTSQDTSVTVSYYWYRDEITFTTSQALTIKTLASIAITTPPNTTDYLVGDTLDLTGIVITASYDDNSTATVTNSCSFTPANGAVLRGTDTTIIVTYTQGGITKNATQSIDIDYPIYGAEWDGTSTSVWSRTDASANFINPNPALSNGDGSSPFDNILPWSGLQRVEDNSAGVLVSIPKYYFKWTKDGVKMKLQISPTYKEGFHVSPAHADRGDGQGERDIVYVGAYHCISNYQSLSGAQPARSKTRSTFRSGIHNLGADIWQSDFAIRWTIAMLYLVEFADWNAQSTIGKGCSDNGSIQENGLTDAMVYHTGTNANARTSGGHTRYRYIEDLWGNVYDWIDGFYIYGSEVYVIKNPSSFNDSKSGGINIGQNTPSGGYITQWRVPSTEGVEYALYPNAYGGSKDTYITDRYGYSSSFSQYDFNMAYVGGFYLIDDGREGLFYINMSTNDANEQVGSRLMKLPNNS